MPDLWERVTGLFAVTVDVFTQVSITSASASTPRVAFNHPGLQRIRLRGVPAIDSVGGPAEGLTYIVTGPTRYAPTTKAMTLQACAYNAYAARSSDSLKLNVSVELAVA